MEAEERGKEESVNFEDILLVIRPSESTCFCHHFLPLFLSVTICLSIYLTTSNLSCSLLCFLSYSLTLPSLLPLLILISLSVAPSLHSFHLYFFFTLSLVPPDLLYHRISTIPTVFFTEMLLSNYTTLPLYVLD